MFYFLPVSGSRYTVCRYPETGQSVLGFSAKLHYTDTGYGHVHNTTNRQATTILQPVVRQIHHQRQKYATSQHLDMSLTCLDMALRCGKFVVQQVVELL